MEYTQEQFMERMRALVETGRQNGNMVTPEDIFQALEGFSVDEERIRLVSQFLSAQKIAIEGLEEEVEADAANAVRKVELSQEEEDDLKLYQGGLPKVSEAFLQQKTELFAELSKGNAEAKTLLTNGYLSQVVELALALYEKEIDLSDLIQEGNLAMILALEEAECSHKSVLSAITQAMNQAIAEVKDVSASNASVVDKVNRLKDAIEQLTEGEEMDFTVEELALFLDMSEDEIRDVLNLTGEK